MPVKKKAPAKAVKTKKKGNVAKGRSTVSARKQSSASTPKARGISLPASPITEKQSKAQIFAELSAITGLGKPEVKNMFMALKNVLERNLKGKGYGEFVIPELGLKVRRIQKGATKARVGRNPFTGEEIKIPAKPARKSVKATALKALKEIVLN